MESLSTRRILLITAATAVALTVSASARAGNGIHPRTPAEFPAPPCMTIVDRSVDPIAHIDYTIPLEDTELTADEVADSRRHQFFALCRDHSQQEGLPYWITQADIDAADAKGLIEQMIPDEQIFEKSATWADCWHRVNADDDRRPITFEMAAMGVDWDTSAIPAGPYVIRGYTWEPALNLWSFRSGVIKVVDDPDDESLTPPAAAITTTTEIVYKNEDLVVEGCVDALAGSTATLLWADTAADTLAWQVYASDVPIEGDGFSIALTPYDEIIDKTVAIRVDVTDPQDRTYSAHMRLLPIFSKMTACPEEGESEGTTFIADPACETDTDAGTETTDPTTGSSTGDPSTTGPDETTAGASETADSSDAAGTTGTTDGETGSDDPKGCGCTSSDAPAGAFALALCGLALLRRRRAH